MFKICFAAGCWMVLVAVPLIAAEKVDRPNIVLMMSDDMGYSDIGCYGTKKVDTPNIDRLATEGFKSTDFHTAASICSPSRAAFLTGAYPQRAGLYMGINPNRKAHWFLGLDPSEITLAEQFQTKGYATFHVGKWHLGTEPEFLPREQGFDHSYGMLCNFAQSPKFTDDDKEVFAKTPLEQLTPLYTERVVRIIREQSHRSEPFFLYYAHNYPHTPYKASERFAGTSLDGVRGDIMQELDWGVGEMMNALDDAGIAENTIVIFTSDNGPTKNEYAQPFRGTKYVTLEGGHRVPFIIRWPAQIEAGIASSANIHAMDLFPTLSAIIDLPLPKDRIYDGVNILPLLRGESLNRSRNTPFFYYNCENLQAIRQGDWKLHLPRSPEQTPFWEGKKGLYDLGNPTLFNLKTDPGESQNLASSNPEIVDQLLRLADDARNELGEYLRPGNAQRPTGSIYPSSPVISNPKDWGLTPESIARGLEAERKRRHPNYDVQPD